MDSDAINVYSNCPLQVKRPDVLVVMSPSSVWVRGIVLSALADLEANPIISEIGQISNPQCAPPLKLVLAHANTSLIRSLCGCHLNLDYSLGLCEAVSVCRIVPVIT